MSYNGLNNPFRPQMQGNSSEQYISSDQSHSGGKDSGSSSGSFGGGGIDDGSLQRAKLKAKLGVGCAAACVLWMVTSMFDFPDFGFGDGFLFAERGSSYGRDDGDYEISKFVDEDALEGAVDPEDDSTRSVAEANRRAGFIGRMFCRGLQKPSYCR